MTLLPPTVNSLLVCTWTGVKNRDGLKLNTPKSKIHFTHIIQTGVRVQKGEERVKN